MEERLKKDRDREEREIENREGELNIYGEEAWRRRAAMREERDGTDFSIEKSKTGKLGLGAEGKMTTAERMMAKMGWTLGKGMGKEEQGIKSALSVKKTDKKAGSIVNESETNKPALEKKVKSVQFNMAPTRVVSCCSVC